MENRLFGIYLTAELTGLNKKLLKFGCFVMQRFPIRWTGIQNDSKAIVWFCASEIDLSTVLYRVQRHGRFNEMEI